MDDGEGQEILQITKPLSPKTDFKTIVQQFNSEIETKAKFQEIIGMYHLKNGEGAASEKKYILHKQIWDMNLHQKICQMAANSPPDQLLFDVIDCLVCVVNSYIQVFHIAKFKPSHNCFDYMNILFRSQESYAPTMTNDHLLVTPPVGFMNTWVSPAYLSEYLESVLEYNNKINQNNNNSSSSDCNSHKNQNPKNQQSSNGTNGCDEGFQVPLVEMAPELIEEIKEQIKSPGSEMADMYCLGMYLGNISSTILKDKEKQGFQQIVDSMSERDPKKRSGWNSLQQQLLELRKKLQSEKQERTIQKRAQGVEMVEEITSKDESPKDELPNDESPNDESPKAQSPHSNSSFLMNSDVKNKYESPSIQSFPKTATQPDQQNQNLLEKTREYQEQPDDSFTAMPSKDQPQLANNNSLNFLKDNSSNTYNENASLNTIYNKSFHNNNYNSNSIIPQVLEGNYDYINSNISSNNHIKFNNIQNPFSKVKKDSGSIIERENIQQIITSESGYQNGNTNNEISQRVSYLYDNCNDSFRKSDSGTITHPNPQNYYKTETSEIESVNLIEPTAKQVEVKQDENSEMVLLQQALNYRNQSLAVFEMFCELSDKTIQLAEKNILVSAQLMENLIQIAIKLLANAKAMMNRVNQKKLAKEKLFGNLRKIIEADFVPMRQLMDEFVKEIPLHFTQENSNYITNHYDFLDVTTKSLSSELLSYKKQVAARLSVYTNDSFIKGIQKRTKIVSAIVESSSRNSQSDDKIDSRIIDHFQSLAN